MFPEDRGELAAGDESIVQLRLSEMRLQRPPATMGRLLPDSCGRSFSLIGSGPIDILAAGLRPELTFTSFGRRGGTTEASTSGLTETQLMKKGQWSSTRAMAHYLHHDDEAKQNAQIKRIKLRKQAARK